MQYRLFTYFLLSCLFFAAPANNARACGNSGKATCDQSVSEKSCCKNSDDSKTSCCSTRKNTHGKQSHSETCPEKQHKGGCHCPCGTVSSSYSGGLLPENPLSFPPLILSSDTVLRQRFYYGQHMPEAVYLAIWQPPQLGA